MMRKCRNVYSKLETEEEDLHIMGGGGFTHHGRRRIHYRIHRIIPSARERGGFRVAVAAASQEAQDEKLKTRSSRRGSRHSCLPCDVELGNQQETDMTSHTPGNGQRLGISKADERWTGESWDGGVMGRGSHGTSPAYFGLQLVYNWSTIGLQLVNWNPEWIVRQVDRAQGGRGLRAGEVSNHD